MSGMRDDAGNLDSTRAPVVTRMLPEYKPVSKTSHSTKIGRLLRSLLIFLLGLLLGILSSLLFLLALSGSNPPSSVDTTLDQTGNVTVQIKPSAILPLIQKSFQQAGMGGNISNLSLRFTTGDQGTLNGNYTLNVFGFSLTRPFTIVAQPLAVQCRLHIRILQASLSGISITQWVTTFENTINQQFQSFSQSRSGSIRYCITGVQTNPAALSLLLQVATS